MFCKNCGEQITDGRCSAQTAGQVLPNRPFSLLNNLLRPLINSLYISSPYTNNRYINSLFPIPAEVWA